MSRSKRNSDFGDLILWGLGAFSLYKILEKNEPVVGQPLVENTKRYWHTKLPPDLNSNLVPISKYGRTIAQLETEFKIQKNEKGQYVVKCEKFNIISQVLLRKDAPFQRIEKFDQYYRQDGRYGVNEIVGKFATIEGTIRHEEKHQEYLANQFKESMKFAQFADNNFNTIKEDTEQKAHLKARQIASALFDEINRKIYNDQAHFEVEKHEWNFYHDEYTKKVLNKGIK